MDLGAQILKILNKRYEPSAFIETKFERYDLAFKTDRDGLPVVAYLGQKDRKGKICGERFTRRLKQLINGTIIKENWEHKGVVT
ncbi:hypothetical protein D3H65_23110 [Paraflavitalea soli]|uniref:Uncharacterized protein n=1 Tax=Paraflavitalea soli TaxID=2315862 RepID=A0A3B7MYA4_9BACT|nr:hypothetical protein [Paraflavitalea soli]AXY76705.1 hypothetical protein D3H65_23110 [Paraflavitalea soli]